MQTSSFSTSETGQARDLSEPDTPQPEQVLFPPGPAGQLLGLSVKALETMRHKRIGPAYRKLGAKVLYHIDDLRAFADGLPYGGSSDG